MARASGREERIARGAPVLIAAPGAVYRPTLAFSAVHADARRPGSCSCSIAAGAARRTCSAASGRRCATRPRSPPARRPRPPRLVLPTPLFRAIAPLAPLGPLLGQGPDLRALVSASHGVTWWASDAKAQRELGDAPRALEAGLRDLTAAPASAAR